MSDAASPMESSGPAGVGSRLASLRAGLLEVDARLTGVDGSGPSDEQRGRLARLVLELDTTLRDLESMDGALLMEAGTLVDLRAHLDQLTGRVLELSRDTRAVATGFEQPPVLESPAPLVLVAASPRVGRRQAALAAGRALTAVGLVAILFLGYEFGITSLAHDRAQRAQLAEFKREIPTTTLDSPAPRRIGELQIPAVADAGKPVAIMNIPRLNLSEVVVEGTSADEVKAGPGHLRSSPLPGEYGNAVIAGRRMAYGGPFRQLDDLHPGDRITVTTGQGGFVYDVTEVRQVHSGEADAFTPTQDSRLTLMTSDPAVLATGRLVVVAKLEGNPIDVPNRPQVPLTAGDLGLSGDPLGLALALIWGQLLLLSGWLAWRSRHWWPVSLTLMLATPVMLVLTLLMFSSFDRFLPGTL